MHSTGIPLVDDQGKIRLTLRLAPESNSNGVDTAGAVYAERSFAQSSAARAPLASADAVA